MNLKSKVDASRRTKNRCKEHSQHKPRVVSTMVRKGSTEALIECTFKCDWMGWLPINELDVDWHAA